MKFLWSVALLFAVVMAVCTVYFFGHGLSVHDKARWLGTSAVCLVLSVAAFYAIVKFDRHTPDLSHH